MSRYPLLVDELDGRDLREVAAAASITTATLDALLDGDLAASLSLRDRVARALGANPIELFRLDPDLEVALADAPSRFVTDPVTLRKIDGAHR